MRTCCTRRQFLLTGAGACAMSAQSAAPEYRRGGMVYRRLGQTGLDLSLLSFGSHTDPAYKKHLENGTSVLTPEGQARRDRQIARAFDLGVNVLDVYESEGQWQPAARAVESRRQKVLISLAHTSPEPVGRNVDRAARLFGHVDLYRFHTADIDGAALENWDMLRKAKEAGKVRAIGIATHIERTMLDAMNRLDDLDYLFFPYNFIHARADYSQFLRMAAKKGAGLIAMKPLAAGSIVNLDPRPHAGARPEAEKIELWQTHNKGILPQAVVELTKSLDRMPDETLCMAALRFVYSRPFVTTAIAGMFDEQWVEDNYNALTRYQEMRSEERAVLDAARRVANLRGPAWIAPRYRWLGDRWGA